MSNLVSAISCPSLCRSSGDACLRNRARVKWAVNGRDSEVKPRRARLKSIPFWSWFSLSTSPFTPTQTTWTRLKLGKTPKFLTSKWKGDISWTASSIALVISSILSVVILPRNFSVRWIACGSTHFTQGCSPTFSLASSWERPSFISSGSSIAIKERTCSITQALLAFNTKQPLSIAG